MAQAPAGTFLTLARGGDGDARRMVCADCLQVIVTFRAKTAEASAQRHFAPGSKCAVKPIEPFRGATANDVAQQNLARLQERIAGEAASAPSAAPEVRASPASAVRLAFQQQEADSFQARGEAALVPLMIGQRLSQRAMASPHMQEVTNALSEGRFRPLTRDRLDAILLRFPRRDAAREGCGRRRAPACCRPPG